MFIHRFLRNNIYKSVFYAHKYLQKQFCIPEVLTCYDARQLDLPVIHFFNVLQLILFVDIFKFPQAIFSQQEHICELTLFCVKLTYFFQFISVILGDLSHPCDAFVLKELLPILNAIGKMFTYQFHSFQITTELKY